MSAKLVVLIEVTTTRGEGTPDDPCRDVTQWWRPEGTFVTERDPFPRRPAPSEGTESEGT